MPTYTYACTQCGHRFDAVQSFTDDALTECPECGGPIRKHYGSIGVSFKGSGFYRTDSRPGTKTSDVEASSKPAATAASSSSEASVSPASSGS